MSLNAVRPEWKYSYRPNRDYQRNITVHVVSREQVKTAAGSFEKREVELVKYGTSDKSN
jgi:hypothetical protein